MSQCHLEWPNNIVAPITKDATGKFGINFLEFPTTFANNFIIML